MCDQEPILVPGDTVWRLAHTDRLAFLVDAARYAAAFVAAVRRARRSVLVLAWDIDSRLQLLRPGEDRDHPVELAAFLSWVLERRPELEVHILCWDYSIIYTLERELLPRLRMGWSTHPRLHFALDADHPVGGSKHEKVVVVDDRVAFIGGIDLGRRRWDTSEHRPDDPRRRSPSDHRYPPFHDVQAVLEGEAAACLGAMIRQRWRQVTGERLAAPEEEGSVWPVGVTAAAEDLDLGLVRTRPEHGASPEVRETERLHLAAIAAARRFIYIENQFFTAGRIGDALAGRLEGDRPPEVLTVTSRRNVGWLEQTTLGGLRARLVRELQRRDRRDRFAICFPETGAEPPVTVHTKLLDVDDCLLYLGSANLSNRSMRLDSEIGIALDGRARPDLRSAIRGLRLALLGEHLGLDPETLAEGPEADGVLAALRRRRRGRRRLVPLSVEEDEIPDMLEPVARLADPEGALSLDGVLHELLPADSEEDGNAPR